MRDFKFFRREPMSFLSYIKFKDRYNRDKYMQVIWEERTSGFDDSDCLRFEGTVYDFYDMMNQQQFGLPVTPIIYEIYKKQQGYFNRSLIFQDDILRNSFFISRRAKLTILYRIRERF